MQHIVWLTGAVGLCLCVGSYLLRTHLSMTLTAAVGVLCWAIHFALQGFWTAALMSCLMAIRVAAGVVIVHKSVRVRWQFTWLSWVLVLTGANLTWQGWVSAPSVIATLFLSYTGFHLKDKPLRFALLGAEGIWLLNGWVTQSTLAMVAACLGMVFNSYSLIREFKGKSALLNPLD